MKKKHTLIMLFFIGKTFNTTPCQEFSYPNAHGSLQNKCLETMYKNRMPYHTLPDSIKDSVPVNIYKQTLNYVLFDEIFKNPTHPDIAKVKELLKAGANPNFVYPLSTFIQEGGKKTWKKTQDMDKAGFGIVALIARQKEFNENMKEATNLLLQYGADINKKSGNSSESPSYGMVTPAEYAQQNGNFGFVEYAAKINNRSAP